MMTSEVRNGFLYLALAICISTSLGSASPVHSGAVKSRVIVGATVIDGTGRAGFQASVRIEGDRITKIGRFVPTRWSRTLPSTLHIQDFRREISRIALPLSIDCISSGLKPICRKLAI